jgi:3'-5' exonuclease
MNYYGWNMTKLFFDIETLPCDEKLKDVYLELKCKGEEEFPEEKWLESSVDSTFGRICCIGYIKEGAETSHGVLCGDEKEMLQQFWKLAVNVDQFIGHNIFDFDFPFIYKHSIIHGIKPRDLSFARYRNMPIYDTMKEWDKWGNNKSRLDTLAKIMGYPTSKSDMDGSQVWPAYLDGKIDDICKYCMKDVILTRQVYYRMLVEQIPEIPLP